MTTSVRAAVALILMMGFYLLALAVVAFGLAGIVGAVYLTYLFVSAGGDQGAAFPGSAPLLLAGLIPLVWGVLRGLLAVSRPAFDLDSPDVDIAVPKVPVGQEEGTRDEGDEGDEDEGDGRTDLALWAGRRLWPMVTELAEKVGTEAPAQLHLTAEVNATVREDTRFLGLIGGTRTLDIGIPLLAALSEDQLRSVLCHELGHYSRNDTRLGAVTYRGRTAVRETLTQLTHIAEVRYNHAMARGYAVMFGWLFARYAHLYLRISTAVARRQELHADARAAQITGGEVTAEALRVVHAAPAAWEDFRLRYLNPMRRQGRVPDQPFSAFHQMITDEGYRRIVLDGFIRSALERPAQRFDSHPCLAERLRHLELDDRAGGDRSGGDRSGSGRTGSDRRDGNPMANDVGGDPVITRNRLLDDLEPLLVRAARRMFPAGSPAPIILPWEEWREHTAEAQATLLARQLVVATRLISARLGFSPTRPTLAVVLKLLEGGHGQGLAGELAALASPPDMPAPDGARLPGNNAHAAAEARLREALCVFIQHALVTTSTRYAEWKISWTGPSRLEPHDPDIAKIPQLVAEAIGGRVHYLQDHLAGLNLSYDRVQLSIEAIPTVSAMPGAPSPADAENGGAAPPETDVLRIDPDNGGNGVDDAAAAHGAEPRRWSKVTIVSMVAAIAVFMVIAFVDFSPGDDPGTAPGRVAPGGVGGPGGTGAPLTNPFTYPTRPSSCLEPSGGAPYCPPRPGLPAPITDCLKEPVAMPSDAADRERRLDEQLRCLERRDVFNPPTFIPPPT
ncbi:MAG TPA: M48 family metallopeptidase [Streptosporangiaceae bacterium]|nr:M48 family metallopeptidase [Streptosporangiaceae bacterium]